MRSLAGSESALYRQLAAWMRAQHPGVPFHFDLSGVHNPSPATRGLYSELNGRAWPDLYIAYPRWDVKMLYHGLFLEIKTEDVKVYLKDGFTPVANPHIREQLAVLEELRQRGYRAEMACGFDQCRRIVDEYLS